jgi:hypothetical protein
VDRRAIPISRRQPSCLSPGVWPAPSREPGPHPVRNSFRGRASGKAELDRPAHFMDTSRSVPLWQRIRRPILAGMHGRKSVRSDRPIVDRPFHRHSDPLNPGHRPIGDSGFRLCAFATAPTGSLAPLFLPLTGTDAHAFRSRLAGICPSGACLNARAVSYA